MKVYQEKKYSAPGVERVSFDYQNTVKYFYESDSKLADDVKATAESFLSEEMCKLKEPIILQSLANTIYSKNAAKGQIEVWIHDNCE